MNVPEQQHLTRVTEITKNGLTRGF